MLETIKRKPTSRQSTIFAALNNLKETNKENIDEINYDKSGNLENNQFYCDQTQNITDKEKKHIQNYNGVVSIKTVQENNVATDCVHVENKCKSLTEIETHRKIENFTKNNSSVIAINEISDSSLCEVASTSTISPHSMVYDHEPVLKSQIPPVPTVYTRSRERSEDVPSNLIWESVTKEIPSLNTLYQKYSAGQCDELNNPSTNEDEGRKIEKRSLDEVSSSTEVQKTFKVSF